MMCSAIRPTIYQKLNMVRTSKLLIDKPNRKYIAVSL